MANISQYMQLGMLNWSLLVDNPRRPLAVYCGLTTDVPTNVSGTEVVDAGYNRGVPAFSSAALVGGLGQSTSTGAMTFGPFSTGHTIQGVLLLDDLFNQLYFAPITPITVKPSDTILASPGALIATLF